MGKKVRWFDAAQRILSTSEPDREEKEDKKPERSLTSKSSFRKLWQFGKSSASNSSSSAATGTAPASQEQPPPQPDRQEAVVVAQAESTGTTSEHDNGEHPVAALASTVAAVVTQAAEAVTSATAILTPRAPASSEEELAAVKIQTACRGYLARKGYQARARARLMSLLEGVAVKRQTEEALYCMQTMTRVQTQIHARRVKKVEDKRALKNQIQPKQGLDKTKIGEGWDHTHQSKEQTEATLAMKQEAASRRQRALSYAFSHQWRSRRTSSSSSSSGRGRVAPTQSHPPTFMDPGCPNWGWSWAERWTAAARPWESQTTPQDKDPAKSAGRAAKPRASISVQVPTTPTGRSARPSPSTPTRPRSPSVPGKTIASPRPTPSPRGRPFNRSGSTLSERPRSSQEHFGGSGGGDEKEASLRRTTSLRAGELPRKLNLGARDVDAAETDGAPVTPSYMQPTKSVRAKARCASPVAADRAEQSPRTPPPVSSPSANRRMSQESAEKQWVSSSPRTPRTPGTPSMSQEFAEKQWVSSSPRTPRTPGTPSKAKAEIRARRPPSPRF